MKQLYEISLSAARKAWLKRHVNEHGWTVSQLRQDLLRKEGEDIDPRSIQQFISTTRAEWLSLNPGPSSLRGRQLVARREIEETLRNAERAVTGEGFDPNKLNDSRERDLRAIVIRRGKTRFRKKLLRAYGNCCAITDCDCGHALEAAHIRAYRGEQTDHVQNGLLLRSDIHTLFDLGKIGIDPQTLKVIVSRELHGTVYAKLAGKRMRAPTHKEMYPHRQVLREHAKHWGLN